MVCRFLPHFNFGGIDYTIDLRIGEFRETEKPWVSIKFDSEQGSIMCEYTGIIQCFNCHKWIMIPNMTDAGQARCVYCGAYVARE